MYRRKPLISAIRTLSNHEIIQKYLSDQLYVCRYSNFIINRNLSVLSNPFEHIRLIRFNALRRRSVLNHQKYGERHISGPSSWKQKRSHYVTLELSPSATTKDIKEAFIRLSKKYHPDLNPDGQSSKDKERFQMVVEAYEVLGDPTRKKEYDASLGLSRKLPFRRATVSSQSEYDEAGNKTTGPMYGVDPEFGRTVDVDLSEEKMEKAWNAYKTRWKWEEEKLEKLEEKKLEFRIMMDKKREMYEALSPEEQVEYKDSIRHFRHPDFAKKSGKFYDLGGNEVEKDPYSSYTSAFRMKMKEKFNIDLKDAKNGTDISLDANDSFASQDPTPPERRKAYRQDSLSNYNLKKSKQNKTLETSNSRTSSDSMQNEDLLSEMIMEGTVTKKQIKDQTNNQELKGQSNDQSKNQEVDDLIKEMNSTNPTTDFYKRTGPAVHYTQENDDKKFRETLEASKRLESLREDPFDTGKTDIPFSYRDPLMGVAYSKGVSNKDADTSFHAQWKHNIVEHSKSDIHSDDSRDSFVKSKSFLTFLVTLLLSIGYVLIKESKGHDVPVSTANVKSRNETEN